MRLGTAVEQTKPRYMAEEGGHATTMSTKPHTSTGRGGIDQTGGKQSGRRIPKSSSTEFECRNASCTKTSASFTRNSSSSSSSNSNSNSPAYTARISATITAAHEQINNTKKHANDVHQQQKENNKTEKRREGKKWEKREE